MSGERSVPEGVDRRLWFFRDDCRGLHYLVDVAPDATPDGPPPLVAPPGRLWAWCPRGAFTCVQESDLTECSDEARYFLRGFRHAERVAGARRR